MKFYYKKTAQGLTLVELLITMVIIMMLAMVGIPSYNKFIANERFAVATNELYNAYRFARNEAIKTSSSMILDAKDGDWAMGWEVTDVDGVILLVSKKPHDSITVSGAAVTVLGMGSLSGAGATFSISDGGTHSKCITMLSSGQSEIKGCP